MGDRANIVIREDWPDDLGPKEAVFLYSHWGGTELPEILRSALERGRDRWNDGSYLSRIVFAEMIRGDIDGETGYGISSRLTDNEYDLLVLNDGRVYIVPQSIYNKQGFEGIQDNPWLSFEDYISVDERTWDNIAPPKLSVA